MSTAGIIQWAMVHWRVVATWMAGLVVFGLVSLATMPRQEFPEFTIRQGLVVGVMPGATADQVEEQLTKPVENYLFSFSEVNKRKTHSVSEQGRAIIFVELREEVKGAEAPAFWAKVRHGLNELKTQQLPPQVVALVGNNDFGNTSALLLTLVAPDHSPRDLQRYLEVVEAHLRRIPATSRLQRYGLQQEVIRVTVSPERLARYGVRPATVWASLQGLGGMPAAARLDGEALELPVHVGQVLRSERELGETILLAEPGGSHVRLKDVATITREYGHDDALVRCNNQSAVVLSVEMQTGNDITRFGHEVDQALTAARHQLPPGVQVTRVADQPRVVAAAVNHFLRDFGLAILAVIAVTMLLLPLRVAGVAAASIPLSVLVALGILNALGVQLQTVSLAGLIVVLGMVVDNAIVIIDDHVARLDHGAEPWSAAWQSAGGLVVPVFTATLAIIMSYAPLSLFIPGMGGDFIGSLPATVAVTLLASLAVAALLVPALNARFIRKGIHRGESAGRPTVLDLFQRVYDRLLNTAFRHPWPVVGLGIGSVAVGAILSLHVPQQFLPKLERNQFAVEVYLPSGRPLRQTDEVSHRLEEYLLADPRVTDVTAFVGTSSPRFHTLYAPNMPSRQYAQLLVNTVDDQATGSLLKDAATHFRGEVPEAWVRWKQLDLQASPSPIEVRLSGDDLDTLKQLGSRIEEYARTLPGVTWVRNDLGEALQGIEVTPDADACARLGVPPAMLQLSLAAQSTGGIPVGTIWEGDYPVRVLLGQDPREPATLDAFRQQYVASSFLGTTVPLEQLAAVGPRWSEGAIPHRNGQRTLSVRVDLGIGVLASPVQQDLERFVTALGPGPEITIGYGGEKESTTEQVPHLFISLLTSIAAIYLILLVQFRRHRQALLIMLTMPLSLVGAMLGLTLTGYPFGMTSFIGVIGLMGLVVRNGIILVGYADELQDQQEMAAHEAAIAAGKRRMRPIFLTSAAAAVGVVPMILSRSPLWGPLGAVTCFGLLTSMVLTLIVLPVAYWLVSRRAAPTHDGPGPAAVAVTVLILLVVALPARAQVEPLTLARCRALTVQRNPEVQQAELALRAAEQTRQATVFRYLPQVSATGMAMRARSPLSEIATHGGNLPVYDGNPATIEAATNYAYLPAGSMALAKDARVYSVGAVQPVYTGGRVVNANRLASLGVEVARDQVLLTRRDAVARTEEKYWQLLALRAKDEALRRYEDLLIELDRQAGDAVQAGLATRNEQLKVALERRRAGVDRLRLDSGLRLAAQDLRRHVGLTSGDSVALADTLSPPLQPVMMNDAPRPDPSRRVEVRLLERAVRGAELQTALTRGETLPAASVGVQMLGYDVAGMRPVNDVMVYGLISVPVSALWEGRHTVASQRLRERIAQSRLSATRDLVALEIEQAADELTVAWGAVQAADAGVAQAAANQQEEADRYANGLVPLADLLEAQVLQYQAFSHRLDTWAEYWLKESAYRRATGEPESQVVADTQEADTR